MTSASTSTGSLRTRQGRGWWSQQREEEGPLAHKPSGTPLESVSVLRGEDLMKNQHARIDPTRLTRSDIQGDAGKRMPEGVSVVLCQSPVA